MSSLPCFIIYAQATTRDTQSWGKWDLSPPGVLNMTKVPRHIKIPPSLAGKYWLERQSGCGNKIPTCNSSQVPWKGVILTWHLQNHLVTWSSLNERKAHMQPNSSAGCQTSLSKTAGNLELELLMAPGNVHFEATFPWTSGSWASLTWESPAELAKAQNSQL